MGDGRARDPSGRAAGRAKRATKFPQGLAAAVVVERLFVLQSKGTRLTPPLPTEEEEESKLLALESMLLRAPQAANPR